MSGTHFFDEEAGDDSDEEAANIQDSSEEEDEEAEEEQLKADADGFIVDEADDDDDDEEIDADDGQKPKKKKRRRKRSGQAAFDLDEDDLNLLEENTGKNFKRHKRLFKRQEQAVAPVGRDAMAREFGDLAELEGLEDADDLLDNLEDGREVLPGDGYGDDDEDDEMDDFIERDGPDGEQYRASRRALAKSARAQGISTEAAQELLDIFGHDNATKDMLANWYAVNEAPEDAELEDFPQEDGVQDHKQVADPTLIQRYHMTDADEEVRVADCPERLLPVLSQMPEFEVEAAAEHIYNAIFADSAPETLPKWLVQDGIVEVDGATPEAIPAMMAKYQGLDEASPGWLQEDGMFANVQGFRLLRHARVASDADTPGWCTIEEWQQDEEAQAALKASIITVIELIFIRKLEVPVIAMFYKESLGELLCNRSGETPSFVTGAQAMELEQRQLFVVAGAVLAENRRMRRWEVLWAVYNEAISYFELLSHKHKRRTQLMKTSIDDNTQAELMYALDEVNSAQVLEDWSAHFRLVCSGAAAIESRMDLLGIAASNEGAAHTRPLKSSRYHIAMSSGIAQLTANLALTTEEFATSVQTITPEHGNGIPSGSAPASVDAPQDIAKDFLLHGYTGTLFSQSAPEHQQISVLLDSAMHVLVQEIAHHPSIRSKVRQLVKWHATVTTTPTDVGEQLLDPFHIHGCIKRIIGKPVSVLLRDYRQQWLHMIEAEKAGLVKMSLTVDNEQLDTFIAGPFSDLYTVGVDPDIHGALHNWRKSVIDTSLSQHLLPHAMTELRRELMQAAEKAVLQDMEDAFWCEVTMPPLRLRVVEDEEATGVNAFDAAPEFVQGQRTCVVCYGEGEGGRLENSTHMVMLDSRAYPIDLLQLPQFSGRIPTSPASVASLKEDTRKADDVEKIVKFLHKHWPHLIVVGASNPECLQLINDFEKICDVDFTQEDRNENLLPLNNFDVRLVKDNVAALYETCAFADVDLKDYPRLVRRGVALGRACAEPLAVLAALLSDESDELLSLQLHPLQSALPRDAWRSSAEHLLLTAVTQVGVSVNDCMARDWLAPLLRFVPGLGPRKAAYLVKAVKSLPEGEDAMGSALPRSTVVQRENLLLSALHEEEDDDELDDHWRTARVLRPRVYANAAPILRVFDPNDEHETHDVMFTPKDNMRVHPKDEAELTEIANVAIDRDAQEDDGEDPIPIAAANREKVMTVEMGAYHAHWQSRHPQSSSRMSIFMDLSFELVSQYRDPREPERLHLTERERFWALTGETPNTLRDGRMLTGKVVWVQPELAGLKTDSGIMGLLDREEANTIPKETLVGNLPIGAEVTARVLVIDYANLRLRLTSKSSELQVTSRWEQDYLGAHDDYYHVLTEKEKADADAAKRAKHKRRAFQQRPIHHSRFCNISAAAAHAALCNTGAPFGHQDKLLREIRPTGALDGDAIFHPSSKGSDRLSITIRLFTCRDAENDGRPVIQNLDIMETKSNKMANHLTLGTPLHITVFQHLAQEDCSFEELDELIEHFLKPYVDNFTDIMTHRKFIHGPPPAVEKHLLARNLDHADYRLGLFRGDGPEEARDGPGVGWGIIVVKTSKTSNIKHVPFRISHKGYYVRLPGSSQSILASSAEKLVTRLKTAMQDLVERPRGHHQGHHHQGYQAVAPYQQVSGPYGAAPAQPNGYQQHAFYPGMVAARDPGPAGYG